MNDIFGKIYADQIDYNIRFLRHVVLEVTERCNLRCKYCALSELYSIQQDRRSRDLPFAYVTNLLDFLFTFWEDDILKEIPTSTTISFYGGEPLLNFPLIEQVVHYIEKKNDGVNRDFSYSMTTNAILLPKYIDFFVRHNFNILISLDGDEYSDSYRIDAKGDPSFNCVYNNSKKIKDIYPDYFANNVSFNSVLTNRNSYEGIVSFFQKEFGKTPIISPLNTSNVNPLARSQFELIQNKLRPNNTTLPFEISPAFQAFKREFETKTGNYYYDFNELIYKRFRAESIYTGTCIPFSKKLFLTVGGKVLQCERISHKYSLGFINEHEVHIDFNEVASQHNKEITKYGQSCQECKIKYICPQCVYRGEVSHCEYCSKEPAKPFGFDSVRFNPVGALEAVYKSKTKR